jgi:hypothetical protein
MFGDWHLALAAYNWGEGSVGRAIARNQKAGLGTSYTDLTLPGETRMYVPKLQAVKNIVAHPDAYGTELPLIENHPYFQTVDISHDIDVALAARLAGVREEDFKALNPSLQPPGDPGSGHATDPAALGQRQGVRAQLRGLQPGPVCELDRLDWRQHHERRPKPQRGWA